MENDIVSDLEVFLEANKESEGRLLIIFGRDVIHRSKKESIDHIAGKLYGLLQTLDNTPANVLKRYVDFNDEGNPIFLPFNLLRNCILEIELDTSDQRMH